MRQTVLTICSLLALTFLTACGSNKRKAILTARPVQNEQWNHFTPLPAVESHPVRCSYRSHRAYGKAINRKASSLTIKDQLK